MLVATDGAVSPGKVLRMRADLACWLIAGRAALNRRAQRSAVVAEAGGGGAGGGGGGDGGVRRVRLSAGGSLDEQMAALKSFLQRRPG